MMQSQAPPITPEGMTALRSRYDHLLGVERPQIVEIVSWAAGNGDRSENGDYVGIEAVIDKDLTSATLATDVGAEPPDPFLARLKDCVASVLARAPVAVAGIGLVVLLFIRPDISATVHPVRQPLFVTLSDGTIRNTYETEWLIGVEMDCQGNSLIAEVVPR